MLDRKFILDNLPLIRENLANRQMTVDLDRFVALESQRKELLQQVEAIRAEANALAKNRDLAVEDRRATGQRLKTQEAELSAQLTALDAETTALHASIPNLTAPQSPAGGEEQSLEIGRGATPVRTFDFPVRDHIELMESFGILDLAAGAKVAGSGFYFLKGAGALLERALISFALEKVMAAGFTPTITPDLARDAVMQGAGFVPRGNESNTYRLEDQDLNLIATSEITLVGQHADDILDLAQPLKYAGLSHCFRSERAHGSATRGIYRVHQFSKVEMVVLCRAEEAEGHHMAMRQIEQEIFDALEIPYRVLEIAAGDLGAPAYRKFDLEAWMPGRQGGSWGEVTSTSNCTDYQARRLNIRTRDAGGKLRFASTLNGTAIATTRAILALLENHQQADGSVILPKALHPYLPASCHVLRPHGS